MVRIEKCISFANDKKQRLILLPKKEMKNKNINALKAAARRVFAAVAVLFSIPAGIVFATSKVPFFPRR
ncbi:MAG: hypothetical protein IT233_02405 [Bacteroidia bacterium]|nr:hypothetical protein [Bacteroidia bacterium]